MNNKSIPPIYENFTQLNNGEIPQFDYIKIYHSFLKLKANELISEAEQLDAQKVKNEKFIEKINSFLND